MLTTKLPLQVDFYLNGPTPANINYFLTTVQNAVSWIRTQIVGVEGMNADHYTTTTAILFLVCCLYAILSQDLNFCKGEGQTLSQVSILKHSFIQLKC